GRAPGMRALAPAVADGAAEPLHLARLALKRWRYAEEASGPRAGDASAGRSLRRWQTRLGDLNDRAQLIAFVAARPQAKGQPLVRRLEALRRASLAALRRQPVAFSDPRPPRPRPPRAHRRPPAPT